MFLQLLVNLLQKLFLKLMEPEVEPLPGLRITGLGSLLRLNDKHGAPLDELACVSANLSIEVSLHGCRCVVLSFMLENATCSFPSFQYPCMKNSSSSDDIFMSVDNHGNLLRGIEGRILD